MNIKKLNTALAYMLTLCVMMCGHAATVSRCGAEILNCDTAEAGDQTENSDTAYADGEEIYLDLNWKYADNSAIHTGCAVYYAAKGERKNLIIGVNAGHGTEGGSKVKTWCHPDHSEKTTGGSTSKGALKATAVSAGMTFDDGTTEAEVTLQMARIFRDKLLAEGYDVLMLRDGEDVQLDNVARTVICNNIADCHISIHWDGDSKDHDKGAFYIAVPEGIKHMEPVALVWQMDDALGEALVGGLSDAGVSLYKEGRLALDYTQTSYSSIPSVDIELGNQCSDHSEAVLDKLGDALVSGVNAFFGE